MALNKISCHLIETRFRLYVVPASGQRHVPLPAVVPGKAVGRRRSLTDRYFAAGGWEALFVTGGRGTSSGQRLLSVMDQLSATEDHNDLYNKPDPTSILQRAF